MLVKFEFNLPEDQHEYEVMSQSPKAQRFLWEFSQQLREWRKYGHNFKDASDAVSGIQDEFFRLLNNYEVNIDL
jgi:hypothetical protein